MSLDRKDFENHGSGTRVVGTRPGGRAHRRTSHSRAHGSSGGRNRRRVGRNVILLPEKENKRASRGQDAVQKQKVTPLVSPPERLARHRGTPGNAAAAPPAAAQLPGEETLNETRAGQPQSSGEPDATGPVPSGGLLGFVLDLSPLLLGRGPSEKTPAGAPCVLGSPRVGPKFPLVWTGVWAQVTGSHQGEPQSECPPWAGSRGPSAERSPEPARCAGSCACPLRTPAGSGPGPHECHSLCRHLGPPPAPDSLQRDAHRAPAAPARGSGKQREKWLFLPFLVQITERLHRWRPGKVAAHGLGYSPDSRAFERPCPLWPSRSHPRGGQEFLPEGPPAAPPPRSPS